MGTTQKQQQQKQQKKPTKNTHNAHARAQCLYSSNGQLSKYMNRMPLTLAEWNFPLLSIEPDRLYFKGKKAGRHLLFLFKF